MGFIHFVVKYALTLINIVFTVLGITVIVGGVLIRFKVSEALPDEVVYDEEIKTAMEYFSTFIIVMGCVVFIISFTGCCGAMTETKGLLITYAVIMFILLLAKIYFTIIWNKDLKSFRYTINEFINDAFNEPAQNETFHLMEALFHCCGTTGPDSYEILPLSCCASESEENINANSVCLIENAFSIGCLELVDNFIAGIANTLKTVLIWVIVFETVEFVAAVYLCTSITDKRRAKAIAHH